MRYDEPVLDSPRWPYVAGILVAVLAFALLHGCATSPKVGHVAYTDPTTDASAHPALTGSQDATDDFWKGNKVTHSEPPPGLKIVPPAGSFGYEGCGKFAIWVFLQDGTSYRIDSEHAPKNAADMKKLLEWLNTAPADIIRYEKKDCGVAT